MKNLNLTNLYLDLVKHYDVTGFDLSSLRKINDTEVMDVLMFFSPKNILIVDLQVVREIVNNNIAGFVKNIGVDIKESKIEIFIEFND